MKKENTTINNTTESKTQEENTMKTFELKKFGDEKYVKYEWELRALYRAREHFLADFQRLYIDNECRIKRIADAVPMIVDYINEFLTTATAWQNVFKNTGMTKYLSYYSDVETGKKYMTCSLSDNDCIAAVQIIYNSLSNAIYSATFAPDGKYRVVRMAYADYKKKHISVNTDWFINTDCLSAYVKTGEYDPETKTIEVYIPESYEKEIEKWRCTRKNGELKEIAAEMAAQRAAEAERAAEAAKATEAAAETTETTTEKQEEKEMVKYNKKQDVIDRVISTYEVVGRERTIHNCEGLDDDNDIEIFGRRDITVLAAEYIFGRSDAEAAENEQLLVSYYESQPERFFERLTTDDILGERLVIRMADDLLDAKTQGTKLDEADRHMCGLNDRCAIRLYRAEFLNTYRKLDIRDDEMENYLANFQTQATAWDHMMSWDYPESGWRFLMNKFYGLDEGERYSWVDHVTDMVTWLRNPLEIATVCGTYSPDNSYREIDYTGYDEFCLETLDVRNSVEEKIHSYESRHPYAAPEPVRFEDVKEFVIKFRYVDLMKMTDEIYQEIGERPAWFRDEYGLTTGYYRAV